MPRISRSLDTCPGIFFFFSSRRRHTRFDCDWSSDVCSSDLERLHAIEARHRKIRKDHVRRELAQRGHKIVGTIDDPRCHTKSRALQLADLKLDRKSVV